MLSSLDGDGGLRIIDVSNPSVPSGAGFFDTPGDAVGVTVAGGYVYIADEAGGLIILRYTGSGSYANTQSNKHTNLQFHPNTDNHCHTHTEGHIDGN